MVVICLLICMRVSWMSELHRWRVANRIGLCITGMKKASLARGSISRYIIALSAAVGVDKARGRLKRNKNVQPSFSVLHNRACPGATRDRQEVRVGPSVYKFGLEK